MNLDPAPVNHLRILPAQITVEIPLPAAAVGQILAPNDVRCAQQVVLHRRLEIEQRPDPVLAAYQGMRGGDDAKSGPVAYGRVLVVHVGLNPQNSAAFRHAAIEHLPPEIQVLLHALTAMLTDPLVLVLLED